MVLFLPVKEDLLFVFLFQVVPGLHQKAAGSAGRVADDLVGLGAIISTITRMICRGVRNWPFTPAVDNLDSKYSYYSTVSAPSGWLPGGLFSFFRYA